MRPIFAMVLVPAALVSPALVAPAAADARDDVLYGISRCGGIPDDHNWLDCVYGAAQPMRSHLGLPPAPSAQQKLVPPAMPGMAAPGPQARTLQAAPEPGFFSRLMTQSEEIPGPPTHLASYRFDGAGFFTVTLANGEVWHQSHGDGVQAHWHAKPASYAAQVFPGAGETHVLKVGAIQYQVEAGG